jgi:hypothetical protein
MDPLRKVALIAGGLYLLTFLAGIPPALILYNDVLNNPEFILGFGRSTTVVWGGLLEIVNAVACIGTAVVLFPVVKRHSEAAALGFVTARAIEAAVILLGVISLLSIVTLRQDIAGAAGAETASLVTLGRALVAVHQWAALIGPGLVPAFNALLLGYLLYRSELVPRIIPLMGLVGGPLLLASFVAAFFGGTEQISGLSAIAVIPIFFWELSLGIYMTFKGFKPSSITSTSPRSTPGAVPVA